MRYFRNSVRPDSTRFKVAALLWFVIPLQVAAVFATDSKLPELVVNDPDGSLGRTGAPFCYEIALNEKLLRAAADGRLYLREKRDGRVAGSPIPIQVEPSDGIAVKRQLWWLMPPGASGKRTFVLLEDRTPAEPVLKARKDRTSGQLDISDGGQPVLRYNYQTIEPKEEFLNKVKPDDRKYARARGDYIHPLYGPDGQELTKDWSVDHPHHRGIYWAWPEVDYGEERGDLHALQRVFARPTGHYALEDGSVYAQIEAENLWQWEDREPIVRERAIIRVYRPTVQGRCIDLRFYFTALVDRVAIARRGTDKYGGLNIRLSQVTGQDIIFHINPAEAKPQKSWADFIGVFAGTREPAAIAVLQKRTNPDYPGEWIKYPELSWFQPTFPTTGTRFVLKKNEPLLLEFRLWIRRGGKAAEEMYADQWRAFNGSAVGRLAKTR